MSDDNQSNESEETADGFEGAGVGAGEVGLGVEGGSQSSEASGAADSGLGADNSDNQSDPVESLGDAETEDDSQSGAASGFADSAAGAAASDNQLGIADSLDASGVEVGGESQSSEVSGTADSVAAGVVDSDNQSGNSDSADGGVEGNAEADCVPVPLIQSGISESDSLCGVSHEG